MDMSNKVFISIELLTLFFVLSFSRDNEDSTKVKIYHSLRDFGKHHLADKRQQIGKQLVDPIASIDENRSRNISGSNQINPPNKVILQRDTESNITAANTTYGNNATNLEANNKTRNEQSPETLEAVQKNHSDVSERIANKIINNHLSSDVKIYSDFMKTASDLMPGVVRNKYERRKTNENVNKTFDIDLNNSSIVHSSMFEDTNRKHDIAGNYYQETVTTRNTSSFSSSEENKLSGKNRQIIDGKSANYHFNNGLGDIQLNWKHKRTFDEKIPKSYLKDGIENMLSSRREKKDFQTKNILDFIQNRKKRQRSRIKQGRLMLAKDYIQHGRLDTDNNNNDNEHHIESFVTDDQGEHSDFGLDRTLINNDNRHYTQTDESLHKKDQFHNSQPNYQSNSNSKEQRNENSHSSHNKDEENQDNERYWHNYHHGAFHHVKVKLHGPGKTPKQWAQQEKEEMANVPPAYHFDENNYDTGAGFFQLDEKGGDVEISAQRKQGTTVRMGGGHFSIIRDPWRYHSAFVGLLHPHEMLGERGEGMENPHIGQFHQHFTYISNEHNENHKTENLDKSEIHHAAPESNNHYEETHNSDDNHNYDCYDSDDSNKRSCYDRENIDPDRKHIDIGNRINSTKPSSDRSGVNNHAFPYESKTSSLYTEAVKTTSSKSCCPNFTNRELPSAITPNAAATNFSKGSPFIAMSKGQKSLISLNDSVEPFAAIKVNARVLQSNLDGKVSDSSGSGEEKSMDHSISEKNENWSARQPVSPLLPVLLKRQSISKNQKESHVIKRKITAAFFRGL